MQFKAIVWSEVVIYVSEYNFKLPLAFYVLCTKCILEPKYVNIN